MRSAYRPVWLFWAILLCAASSGGTQQAAGGRGSGCKTVGSAYVGSNPTPATPCENGPLAAETRPGGPFPSRHAMHQGASLRVDAWQCLRTYRGQRPGRTSGACNRSLAMWWPSAMEKTRSVGGKQGNFRSTGAMSVSDRSCQCCAPGDPARPRRIVTPPVGWDVGNTAAAWLPGCGEAAGGAHVKYLACTFRTLFIYLRSTCWFTSRNGVGLAVRSGLLPPCSGPQLRSTGPRARASTWRCSKLPGSR